MSVDKMPDDIREHIRTLILVQILKFMRMCRENPDDGFVWGDLADYILLDLERMYNRYRDSFSPFELFSTCTAPGDADEVSRELSVEE